MQDCHEEEVHTALNGQVTNLHNGTILSLKILSLKYLVDNDVFSL